MNYYPPNKHYCVANANVAHYLDFSKVPYYKGLCFLK